MVIEGLKSFDDFLNENNANYPKEEIVKEEIKKEAKKENTVKQEPKIEEKVEIINDNEEIQIESNNGLYKIYRDKSENFTCEIQVDGASIEDTKVRLLFETNDWNIFIDGEIDSNGNVQIPIKKMNIFSEGTRGKIKMEVIADNTVFIPWEDDFEVKMSKSVQVKFNENKNTNNDKSVNVKFKK